MTSAWQPETATKPNGPELDDAFDAELEAMALEVAQPPLEEPREPGIGRYLKFQVRDYVKHRASMLVVVALLGLWVVHYNLGPVLDGTVARRNGLPLDPAKASEWFRQLATGGAILLAGIGSLVSVGGLVSRDREGGYQKFLFAKPVRIARFYLQSLAVSGIGLMAITLMMMLVTSAAFFRAAPLGDAMLGASAVFAAVGGLTFLLSTIVRFDLVAALALGLLAFLLRVAAMNGKWWGLATSWLLPPLDMLRAFFDDNSPDKPSIAQAVGALWAYGAAYVALGVAVLKRRSIIR